VTEPAYQVRYPDGSTYGPSPIEEVQQWAREGRIPAGSWARQGSEAEWQPIYQFPEIAAALPKSLVQKLIPKNTYALISYYIGIFSLVGMFCYFLPGLIMGLMAIG